MTDVLATLTAAVNEVLAEENHLLEALNLPAAAGLLPRKRKAVAALQAALADETAASELAAGPSDGLRDNLRRLAELGDINRSAIERGLALQMRLMQTIARAIPRARAVEAPVYRPNGSQLPARPPEAYAFLSRM